MALYAWIYRSTEWYITDPHARHAEREARTVRFPPTVVPSYDGLLDRAVKIVGVSDDHDLVARCEADVQAQFASSVVGNALAIPAHTPSTPIRVMNAAMTIRRTPRAFDIDPPDGGNWA